MGRVATHVHDIEVEDTATAVVNFESGATGIVESTSSVRTALKSRLELHGDSGTVVANAQYDKFLVWDVKGDDGRVEVERNFELTDIDDPWAAKVSTMRSRGSVWWRISFSGPGSLCP